MNYRREQPQQQAHGVTDRERGNGGSRSGREVGRITFKDGDSNIVELARLLSRFEIVELARLLSLFEKSVKDMEDVHRPKEPELGQCAVPRSCLPERVNFYSPLRTECSRQFYVPDFDKVEYVRLDVYVNDKLNALRERVESLEGKSTPTAS